MSVSFSAPIFFMSSVRSVGSLWRALVIGASRQRTEDTPSHYDLGGRTKISSRPEKGLNSQRRATSTRRARAPILRTLITISDTIKSAMAISRAKVTV